MTTVFKIWILRDITEKKDDLLEQLNKDRKAAKTPLPSFESFDQMVREFSRDLGVLGEKLYNDFLSGSTSGHLEFYDLVTGNLIFRSENPVETLKWVNLPMGIETPNDYKPKIVIEGRAATKYDLYPINCTESLSEMIKTSLEFEEAISKHAKSKQHYDSVVHGLQIYVNRRLVDLNRITVAKDEGQKIEEALKVEGKEKEEKEKEKTKNEKKEK